MTPHLARSCSQAAGDARPVRIGVPANEVIAKLLALGEPRTINQVLDADLCELLGLDPMYLANEGKLVAFVHPGRAEEILAVMKNNPLGENSCIIGEVMGEPSGKVIMQTSVGGSRFIEMLVSEDLPRIC